MASLKVTCPSCQQVITLEGSRIPDGRVSFSCPGCGGQIVLDRNSPPGGGPRPAAPASAPVSAPTTPMSSTPADDGLPPGATLPSGVVISDDQALVKDVQKRFAEVGSTLRPAASASEVRALPPEELPALVVFAAGNVAPPPVEALRPLTSLAPMSRRRTYVVLIASDVGTMDGNSAFVFDVNLTVNRSDVDRLVSVLHTGLEHHRRLYARFNEAMRAVGRLLSPNPAP